MIKTVIASEVLNDFAQGVKKEWITANGLGGYASSTLINCNSRRYHGLLVVPDGINQDRSVLLAKLEETVKVGNRYYYLSTNQYSENYTHPRGYTHLRKFVQDPFPRFLYTIEDVVVEKEIFMLYLSNTVVIRYRIFGPEPDMEFTLHPLTAFRNFHQIQRENSRFDGSTVEFKDSVLSLKPYPDFPQLRIHSKGMSFKSYNNWYKNFQYAIEKERGLDYIEDLFNPGYLSITFNNSLFIDIIATCEDEIHQNIDELYNKEAERQENLIRQAGMEKDPEGATLVLSADFQLIQIPSSKKESSSPTPGSTIVAGYHWFGDWGRDTFIALPGITLATGRFEEALNILKTFAGHCHKGLIPNRFEDLGKGASYNTVDASLWYINAVSEYLFATGDSDSIKDSIYPTCKEIVKNYAKGTLYGIGMDEDGLIRAGEEGYQLTWMDAKVGNWVVTPRMGKPVEINALWYNALMILSELAERFGEKEQAEEYEKIAQLTKKSFNEKFWYPKGEYLYDVLETHEPDRSIRPNQIYAVSLPHRMLSAEKEEKVVSLVWKKLYTPYGLRSLSPEDPRYKGHYLGNLKERDGAYHQGIAWGHLMGAFIEAFLNTHSPTPDNLKKAQILMDTWMSNLFNHGINTLSEILDGDEPYQGRGCISQAWTIAEALRLKKKINRIYSVLQRRTTSS